MLGPALILSGIMLLIGLGTRISLLAQALLYVAPTVGLILIDDPEGIAYLGIHMGLIAAAFMLARYNNFCSSQEMVKPLLNRRDFISATAVAGTGMLLT
jgi:hypothetical protein